MKRNVSAKTFMKKCDNGDFINSTYHTVDGFASVELSATNYIGDTYTAKANKDELLPLALMASGLIKKP